MTAALIIAAGATSGAMKIEPLKKSGGITALRRLALLFSQAGVADVIVVCGENRAEVEKELSGLGVIFLQNPNGAAQMIDNVKYAIEFMGARYDAFIMTQSMTPLFSADTVRALMGTKEALAGPEFRGKLGHPLIIGRAIFAEVMAYEGEEGMKGFIREYGSRLKKLSVDDRGVTLYVGRPGAESAAGSHSISKLRAVAEFSLAREKCCFDAQACLLMQLVQDTGNIRAACEHMGVSYSKGWKRIANMESALGFALITRRQGGSGGGKSLLTERGEDFMARYKSFVQQSRAATEQIFDQIFGDMKDGEESE